MVQVGNLIMPLNKLVVQGPSYSIEARVETVANVYPGRLLKRGTTDDDVVVCGATDNPVGWAGYEDQHPRSNPQRSTPS